jgi:hypothetical protein
MQTVSYLVHLAAETLVFSRYRLRRARFAAHSPFAVIVSATA